MRNKDTAFKHKVLKALYPYYDTDINPNLMPVLRKYYEDAIKNEEVYKNAINTSREIVLLLMMRHRLLIIEQEDKYALFGGGKYTDIGHNNTGAGKPIPELVYTLYNLPFDITGTLTDKGYLYIKKVIELERQTKMEWIRFGLTLAIATIVAVCTVFQTYKNDTLETERIELKIQQQRISKIFDSIQQELRTYHISKPKNQ